jgi:hypothetical protein
LNQKEFALGVFLDKVGAFENAFFGSINTASGKHVVVLSVSSGSSIRMLVNWGCPQGGVLSPLLWNMVVDGLVCRSHDAHYQAQSYADDMVSHAECP